MANINIFGHLPNVNALPWGSQEDTFQSFANFCKMIEAAHREKDTDIYYDSNNVIDFIDNIDSVSDSEAYFENPKTRLRHLFFRKASDWREQSKQVGSHQYFHWSIETFTCEQLPNDTLCEIAEFLITYQSKSLLLRATNPSKARSFYAVFKDAVQSPNLPTFYEIPFVFEMQSLENWLLTNRKKRVFNYNQKHGENGVGHWNGESPLRCSQTRAHELLKTAIGDKSLTKELYNYDNEHQRYIVFKLDGDYEDRDSYHGYHVDNENEVDASIRTLLMERLGQG